MKLAVLGDIHGNHVALTAVLGEARRRKVDHIAVLGDNIGYYYHPGRCLELLEKWPATFIRGNHEDMLAEVRRHPERLRAISGRYGQGLQCALEQLTGSQQDWLVSLPEQTRLELDGIGILICHGTPWDADAYIYPDAPGEAFLPFDEVDADYVFMAHTHYPYIRAGRGKTLVNAGSVGQPRDYGGLASWMILDTCSGVIVPVRTPFDTGSVIREARQNDPGLSYLWEVQGRNLRGD